MPIRHARLFAASLVAAACGWLLPEPTAVHADDPTMMSREELVRKWDLDGDGSIDAGEAELARNRMRRERATLRAGAGVDPLTGQPRTQGMDGEKNRRPVRPATPPDEQTPFSNPPGRDGATGRATPDADAYQGRASESGDGTGRAVSGVGTETTTRSGARRPGTVPPPLTGGARGGAVSRPGYGSPMPRPDLNAGRLPAGLPGRRSAPASGGLLPSIRRPSAAPTPVPRPPRRTVDDFDVY